MSRQNRTRIALMIIVGVCVVFGVVTPALAHSVSKRLGDFYGGMLHPLTALEHLLPILGLSLLAGQQGPRRARWVLLLFPAGLLAGAMLSGYVEPAWLVTWFNRLTFVAVGILVAAAARLPLPVLGTTAFVLGLSHGVENTVDISSSIAMHLFVPGVVVSGIAMVAIFAAIAVFLEVPWQRIAIRVVGSWIAAIGILVIGLV
jgi:urease accessory protein